LLQNTRPYQIVGWVEGGGGSDGRSSTYFEFLFCTTVQFLSTTLILDFSQIPSSPMQSSYFKKEIATNEEFEN